MVQIFRGKKPTELRQPINSLEMESRQRWRNRILPSFKVIKVGEIKYKAIDRTAFFMVIHFMVQTGQLNTRIVKKYIRVF